ncbi:3'-5' exonuclease [Geomicrobium sp. JCM 19055]|uniref:3'-5' exonuclease n=1 Tax=Geomicrobium sp. JCM 19055 TaxID=1460649 RepID=UPI00045ECDE7|nr:3'-5' exonuclease [Geomicrobium sp. JCM 19055]GAJ99588.1 putative ATP-dependent DNA helicase YjcD [Geomicrobium sp. JCM 19055]
MDDHQSLCSRFLSKLLFLTFDAEQTVYNFVNEYYDREYSSHQRIIKVITNLIKQFTIELKDYTNGILKDIDSIINLFKEILSYVYPNMKNDLTVENLIYLLEDKDRLNSFIPAKDNEIQLMNLYKAKGLEFEVVIHLDLYQYILPEYEWIINNDMESYKDTLNLHYVGVTRAKKAIFLMSSTKRYQVKNDRFIKAQKSEFLSGDMEPFQTKWNGQSN